MARIISICWIVVFLLPVSTRAGQTVIGVLPFDNVSKDQELAWFEDGAAKAVAVELAKHPGLKVVDKSQADQALAQVAPMDLSPEKARRVGRLVGASLMVYGDFQKFGEQLKLSAHIVKVSTGAVVDSASTSGKVSEIFALQDQVSGSIAGYLKRTVPARPTTVSPSPPPVSDRPLAVQPIPVPKPRPSEMKSSQSQEDEATRRLLQRRGSVETENEATRRLMEQKSQGPQSAVEWYNKGVALNDNSDLEIEYYIKAIQVDPTYSKAYYNLGTVYYTRGMKAEAVDTFRKYLLYSKDEEERAKVQQFLSQLGDVGPAPVRTVGEQERKLALEFYNKGVGLNDDSPQEIEYYRQALAYDPYLGKAHYNLGLIYYRKNMRAEALAYLKKYLEYTSDPPEEKERIRPIVEFLEKSAASQGQPPAQTPPSPTPPGGVREEPL